MVWTPNLPLVSSGATEFLINHDQGGGALQTARITKANALLAELARLTALESNVATLQGQIVLAQAQAARVMPPSWPAIGIHPVIVQQGAGPKRVTLSQTPESFFRRLTSYRDAATSSVLYVDDQDGNDGNAGTAASPVKTLAYAASTSTKRDIIVRAGRYTPPHMTTGDTAHSSGAIAKRFFFCDGVTIATPGPRLQDLAFTTHTGTVDKCTVTPLTGAQTIQRVVRVDQTDPYADEPLPLKQYASLAALVAATGNGWFIETGISGDKIFYIRMDDPGDAPGHTAGTKKLFLKAYYLTPNFDAEWSVGGLPVLMKGNAIFDGVDIRSFDVGGSLPLLCVDGIRSRFAPNWTLQANGGTTFVRDVVGHCSAFDIFNFNAASNGTAGYGIEWDTRGTCAGDILTYGTAGAPNKNGSSCHDNFYLLRLSNFYEQCFGPLVADISNAGQGTTVNIGVITGGTPDPQSIGFFNADHRKSYYDMCHAYGTTTPISQSGDGWAKQSGSTFEGTPVGSIGTYNPATGL
jgi:hypothetical protein